MNLEVHGYTHSETLQTERNQIRAKNHQNESNGMETKICDNTDNTGQYNIVKHSPLA